MSRGVNKVILVGTLGKEPETRYMPSGGAVTSFSIATNESWKDKQTGEKQERCEWHNITAFNKLGEICGEYLKKGQQVYIEGSLRTEKWTDKQGNDRYTTKIIANNMQMLGSKGGEGYNKEGSNTPNEPAPTKQPVDNDGFDDDIPFRKIPL